MSEELGNSSASLGIDLLWGIRSISKAIGRTEKTDVLLVRKWQASASPEGRRPLVRVTRRPQTIF